MLDVIGARLVEVPPTPVKGSLPAGLAAVALPGPSPSHTGYRLQNGRSTVLFVGDLLDFPDLQGRPPDISVLPDSDPLLAANTRRQVLYEAAADDTILAGAHLGPRGLRRVTAAENGTRLF